jgi:hypothetical protein
MENKYRKFYVEWWNIKKSTIWALIAGVVLTASLVTGGIWASRNNWFIPEQDLSIPKDAAKIISFEGEVRITRATTRETILVTKETFVAAGDTVQTQSDGRAIIQMIDGSVYSVRPNSTIVVKDTTSLFGGKNVRVALDDGQLNVRTGEQPEDARNIVEVADTENRLLPKTDASFNADAQSNAGEIRISRGGVETTIAGERQVIGENEFASIKGGKLSQRERLLAPPRPSAPSNSAQMVDRGGGATVAFSWADPEAGPAANYHLQVSRSPTFAADAMLVDRSNMSSREYRLSSLPPGTYYWRVRAIARSGQLTNWNEAWKFIIVRAEGSVKIDAADWSVERVGGNVYLLTGRTNPGMFVRSQGRETLSGPDGTFKLQISTQSIETVVEIGDDRGNRSGFVISLRNSSVLRRY